ncbi:kinase-like domain-containing protein [Melanogaster broomeanus]|nr:kinase-like domain-containing protein [Melanogaster broomeanus]
MIRRELGIWRRLEHNNIVPFLGIVYGFGRRDSKCASLVSLWMPNGTLQSFLTEHVGELTATRRLRLVRAYMINDTTWTVHSFPFIHGDLNCNNVLLDENFNARLADFGYASLLGEKVEGLAYLQMSTTSMRPGTLRCAAPERIFQETVQPMTESDIYSFGSVAFQVFSGEQPWSEVRRDANVIIFLSQGKKPSWPQSRPVDDQYWEFIGRCWAEMQERPPAKDIVSALQHFLASHLHPPPLGNFEHLAMGRKRALLIAVREVRGKADFHTDGLDELPWAHRDAKNLKERLISMRHPSTAAHRLSSSNLHLQPLTATKRKTRS